MKEIVPKEYIDNMSKSASDGIENVSELVELVDGMTIENQRELEHAVKLIAMLMDERDAYTEKCEGWTKPLEEVIDSIKDTFNGAIDVLRDAEKILKNKIDSAFCEFEAEGDRLLKECEEAGPELRAVLLERCSEIALDKIKGLSMRPNKKNVIEEERKTVEWAIKEGRWNLLKIDPKALNEMVSNFVPGKEPVIPGVKYDKSRTVVITRSRIEL